MNDSKYEITARLIKDIFDLQFNSFKDDKAIKDFCKRHRAIEKQSWLSFDGLKLILEKGNENKISYYEDILHIRIILFYYKHEPIILGPYLPEDVSIGKCVQLCNTIDKKNMDATELLIYFGKYPVIPERHIERIITAVSDSFELGNLEAHYTIYGGDNHPESDLAELTRLSNDNIESHYCTEREYMNAIKRGSLRDAIHFKKLLTQNASGMWSSNITNEGRRISFAVNRAMSRIAAYEAGVPAPIIHKITSKESAAIAAAGNERAMEEASIQMLREFCDLIRDIHNKKYSAMVQSVIYSINQQYMDNISVHDIADEIGVSESYMIAQFKRETGTTPAIYLRDVRLKNAANLLISTEEEIQKICGQVGIQDANYFVKLFKSSYGITPKAYRKQHKI